MKGLNIVCVGGGPAALYFGILMKKAFPVCEIDVIERNREDDTFGWGVVFSAGTLGNLEEADPESYSRIADQFVYWDDIETYVGGARVVSTGHGFCGLSRKRLLMILHDRCRDLGVRLAFQRDIKSVSEIPRADLVLAADGANSLIRDANADRFKPSIDWRRCRFSWLGTTKPMRAFTFIFKENEHGLFQVHAYPFEKDCSTWIVECREEVWRKAGLDNATEDRTVAYCEDLFRDDLDGHRLLPNRSLWRAFPTISNERWHHGNIVLVGDAAHTAHFSIGSGTKLAMEDAIALVDAFKLHGTLDVPRVLAAYEEARHIEVIRTQRAAQTSLEWFENSARYLRQPPTQFTFNLMTRSKRITYDNLRLRDANLVDKATEWYRGHVAAPEQGDGSAPAPIFTPFRLRGMDLANRIVVSPMCQYSAVDGTPNDWHLVHLGSRAIGGAGLVMTEMTDVTPEGRITTGCTGLYTRDHVASWKRIVEFVHTHSRSKIGIQLAHAGRKGSVRHPWEGEDVPLRPDEGAWPTMAPSAFPFYPDWPAPREMDRADMDQIRDAFARAAALADEAGFDLIEIHMAHGYLLSSFISPLSNRRVDAYGGTLEKRMRFPLEVFYAMRAAFPAEKPMSVRVSATDWLDEGGGQTVEETVRAAWMLKEHGCDIIDVSSAGNVPESKPIYGRMYQVPFAEQIRHEAGIPVMTVGGVQDADQANTILLAGRADLCVMARPHLADPYLTLHAAAKYGHDEQHWPGQYLLGRPRLRPKAPTQS